MALVLMGEISKFLEKGEYVVGVFLKGFWYRKSWYILTR